MSFLFALFLLLPQPSLAAINCPKNISTAMLRCNLPIGPIQEVYVYSANNQLNLCELNMNGGYYGRTLSQQEWVSKKIQLNVDGPGFLPSPGILKYQSDDWFYEFHGVYGNADCWIGG